MMVSTLAIIFTFGVVVFVHELGHFIMCKMVGIRVLQFALGFGPEIFGKEINGTRYSICWVPLGGFVKPAGEEIDEAKGEADEFFSKPWYKRILVVFAGPFMNYILGIILFAFLFFIGIVDISEKPIVGELMPDKPAYKAGLEKDDIILSLNSVKVGNWRELSEIISKSAGVEIIVEFRRRGEIKTVSLMPELDEKRNIGMIGIMPVIQKYEGVLSSIKGGTIKVYTLSVSITKYLWNAITELKKPEIAGPIGIAQIVSKAADEGFYNLLFLIAMLSVMIGWFNLLPISPLDGGHAALYLFEGISRKKLNKKIIQAANMVGIALVLIIFVFATYSDIVRWRSGFWK